MTWSRRICRAMTVLRVSTPTLMWFALPLITAAAAVSELSESPYPFTGTLHRVVVDISEPSFEDLAAQHEAHARIAKATQ